MDIYTHINEEKKTAVSNWLQEDMDNIVDFGECDKSKSYQLKWKRGRPEQKNLPVRPDLSDGKTSRNGL